MATLDLAVHMGSELRSLGLPAQLWTPSPVKAKAVDGDSAASETGGQPASGVLKQQARCRPRQVDVLSGLCHCSLWRAGHRTVEERLVHTVHSRLGDTF